LEQTGNELDFLENVDALCVDGGEVRQNGSVTEEEIEKGAVD
jgi:hypothetical protein